MMLPEYARLMARRVEYQVRSDWQYLGGLWNLLFKTLVNHAPSLSFQFSSTAGGVGDADAESVGSAAVSLSKKLWHGEYMTIAGRRKPISGDITKLGYAIGLSPTEITSTTCLIESLAHARSAARSGTGLQCHDILWPPAFPDDIQANGTTV